MRRCVLAVWVLLALAGWSACRYGPPPEELYREAEGLRLKFEKAASERAVERFEAAALEWSRRHDPHGTARARQRAGATYTQLGLLLPSLRAYEAALDAARSSADPSLESDILSAIGTVRSLVAVQERDFTLAQSACESALSLARRTGGGPLEARAHLCLGESAYNQGQRDRALDAYRQSVAIASRVGDRQCEAEALSSLGSVHSDMSEYGPAESCLSRAIQGFDTLGDVRGAAIARVGVAKLRERRGDYQAALNGLREAREALERVGDRVWEGVTLSALGSVYMHSGETATTLEYWERALVRFNEAGLSPFAVDQLRSLGEAYLESGDPARALDRFEMVLTRARELGDDHWQAYALEGIGSVHLRTGDWTKAMARLTESLAVYQRIRDPRSQAQTLTLLAEAWRLAGDPARARDTFEQALVLSRASEDRLREAQALDGLARLALARNDLDAARIHIEQAIAVSESLRARLAGRDMRASYLASVYRYYQTRVAVLMALHRARPQASLAAAAFDACEQARARALLDGLAEAGVDPRTDVDPELVRREEALEREFDAWALRQRRALDGPAQPDAVKRLAAEFRNLETRHGAIDAEIRSRNPRYAALVRPQPLTLRQVQQSVLDADSVLLEFALGEDRSFVWAVSKTSYTVHELPSRSAIEREAHQLLAHLTARLALSGALQDLRRRAEEADLRYWESAASLSRLLLGALAPSLPGKRIVVVPDGVLQFVPFGALPDPARPGERVPLVVDHEIAMLPSASTLAILRRVTAGRRPPAGKVAVLADPVFEPDDPRLRAMRRHAPAGAAPLPPSTGPGLVSEAGGRWPPRISRLAATRAEADAIAAAAGPGASLLRLGFDASRSVATSGELAGYRIVHFATHGVLDDVNPGLSGIMLSLFGAGGEPVDGFLRLRDIYDLDLPADLVVLSACSTALGRRVNGEGLVGVVRGFMYGGAKRVVASLWKVDDEATGELMRRFYVGMFRDGLSPTAALREAQLEMRQQRRWQAPYYWAAFTLQGEWQK